MFRRMTPLRNALRRLRVWVPNAPPGRPIATTATDCDDIVTWLALAILVVGGKSDGDT